ncbi:uncharacterized protein LOC106140978 [Amyelois transitella]|uniref:uncharacterized protein LOC106140978 n=1 Tax=Amyelois transitella TaxID=680683 RepID=UPI00298F9255|nr:uncharacterized protein LOC106140978 [Amyelois transitella]
MWGWLLCLAVAGAFWNVDGAGAGAARLVCYVGGSRAIDGYTECSHLVYTGNERGDKLDTLLKEYRKNNPRIKIVLRVTEVDKDLRKLLKSKHLQGLEIYDAHKTLNRTKVQEAVDAARSIISSSGGGPLFLALPAHPELLAKYYDLRALVKKVDLLMVQTHALGFVKKMAYHPSRLSGVWDMMNTDSVVDLVVGLGVPASKVVISLPATALKFSLLNETLSTPGSPTVEDQPKVVDQAELCRMLQKGRWTLERDQDLSAPYAFKNTTWVSFEDASSVDVKGKYARVRGLAGLALHQADRDVETPCGPTLKASLMKVLNQQSRAPRAAVLRSLEHEILSAPSHARVLDALQVSPYRITQVVDSDGVIHSIREDTRTEFSCSRQGYFVHPRSCARFYRCVKFDQLSPEYTVFEFDCPAGLAFDSRYEVCVWPGSLPHSQACPGSSEIAPVPQTRFICPEHEGYYADPENCRWFFACLDHGKAPLTAYEFRCPFGLGFDAEKLKCDWPWLVPACGNIARYEAEAHGFSAATLTGAVGFQGQTADAINVAAHQSLVSGASLNNLVGIQNGFLTKEDALDGNFIASQELANGQYDSGLSQAQDVNGLAYQAGDLATINANVGLVQPKKYTSGSIILGDYRLPSKPKHQNLAYANFNQNAGASNGFNVYAGNYKNNFNYDDNESGAYVHDPSGDYAEPYKHVDAPAQPYVHDDQAYKHTGDYSDAGKYAGSYSQTGYQEKYAEGNAGQYVADYSGSYVEQDSSNSGYRGDKSGSYIQSNFRSDHLGSYVKSDSLSGAYKDDNSGSYVQSISSNSGYKDDNSGAYVESGYSNNGYTGQYSSSYATDNSGSYNNDYSDRYSNGNSKQYEAGVYRAEGHIGSGANSFENNEKLSHSIEIKHGAYSSANTGNYVSDSKTYTGASHTLTAGAVNVGLVGKTTLIDADYNDQFNYQGGYNAASKLTSEVSRQTLHPGHVSYVDQPAVSVSHVGTDSQNIDGYGYVTTPTSSGVPTTATPFAVTTAIPITTYKTTFVPEAPKSTITQVFGITHPAVTYVQPTVVAVTQHVNTPKVEVSDYNQAFNYQYESQSHNSNQYASSQSSAKKSQSGYDYSKPDVKFEDGLTYTTAAPVVPVSTFKPQGFSYGQQTLHNVESVGFDYSTAVPVTEPPFKKIVAYTTGPSVTEASPHAYSHQTIHKVESSQVNIPSVGIQETGYEYEQPKTVIQYTTPQPAVVSTYQPHLYSHQTVHKVDASQVKTYTQGNSESGYEYSKPAIKFEDGAKTVFEYSTPAPVVSTSTYKPHSYSHQTIHKIETQNYNPVSSTSVPKVEIAYQPAVSIYKNPILTYTENVTPTTYVEPSYKTNAYSHQTIHKSEEKNDYGASIDHGSTGYQSSVLYEQPKSEITYSTPQPAISLQPVVSTYEPHVFSHQTLHKVEASKINTYSHSHESSDSGYEYKQPDIKFEESPQYQYSTSEVTSPAPVVVSTYKPQIYSHQTVHKVAQNYIPVSSTPKVEVDYQQPSVTVYENPILKYTENVTPVPYVQPTATVYTQTYQPIVAHKHEVTHVSHPVKIEAQQSFSQIDQGGYSYNQPEIQREIEFIGQKSHSDGSIVSNQVFHQSNVNQHVSGKDIVFVSTTPSTLAYEDHYNEYESPKNIETYKTQQYTPQKSDYQSYSTVSTPIVQHHNSVIHKAQEQIYYKPEYTQEYDIKQSQPVQQVSFDTSHISQPRKESIHLSTFPGTTITTKYKKVAYESPKIQDGYKAEEYLPPVVSTVTPIVSSTFSPSYSTVSTSNEYLPPITKEYLPPTPKEYLPPASEVNIEYSNPKYLAPNVENAYLPPSTRRTVYKSTTQNPSVYVKSTTEYNAPEYLPPSEENKAKVVNFETFGYNEQSADADIGYNPYQEYTVSTSAPVQRKQNLVVQTAKSNLLGFGTVGPDAGLVSQVSYTTSKPTVVSSTSTPYRYVESTTQYQAPEYLPPTEDSKIHRKQNIVVETAKSQLGFGTVGSDAGLVSSSLYTTVQPIVSTSDSYSLSPKTVSSTYLPSEQEIVEVTPVPVRRTKPKVAVVTKINDFNPLLVRKLGAVCSCQSPVLVLKGKRPYVKNQEDFDDYSNDYDDSDRGDISNAQWGRKSSENVVKSSPVVTSTYNPIIVPDDSYYQDYQESSNYEPVVSNKGNTVYSENFVSSTPTVISTTEKILKIRPRVKAVTVAPTYKTVLLNQEITPSAAVKAESADSIVNSQAFDRYGPGGWRSRDETLQGSVDCQRAGLFRHPKQCNKFYACRWDCTKQRFTLHVFNCPVQLSFDPSLGACNWPSQGPACQGDTLLTNTL